MGHNVAGQAPVPVHDTSQLHDAAQSTREHVHQLVVRVRVPCPHPVAGHAVLDQHEALVVREHAALERFMESRGLPRMHYTVEPEGTKVITQVGQGFLAEHSLSAEREPV